MACTPIAKNICLCAASTVCFHFLFVEEAAEDDVSLKEWDGNGVSCVSVLISSVCPFKGFLFLDVVVLCDFEEEGEEEDDISQKKKGNRRVSVRVCNALNSICFSLATGRKF